VSPLPAAGRIGVSPRRFARKAAALLLAFATLGMAFEAHALVIPKGGFGRGFVRGTPHEVPNVPHGKPGAGDAFLHSERPPEPEIFLSTSERARQLQKQAARPQATVPHDAAPWPDQPHLRVRLTGDPHMDALLIAQLESHLGGSIDSSRIRVASLADDAPADHMLDTLPSGMRDPGRLFENVLRRTPDALNAQRLAAALEVHRGNVLLLMAHIDAQRPVIVFRDAQGGQREISLQALQWAERQAGVDVVLIGCNSADHRAAGFAGSLNSLDAAAAVLRVADAHPASYRELFGRLAGPQLEMLIDPEHFQVHGELTVVRSGSDVPVSTVRWAGAQSQVRQPFTAGPAPSAPASPPADASGPDAVDQAGHTAQVSLVGVVMLSWLTGVALGWRQARDKGAPWRMAVTQAVWHVAVLAIVAGSFAEAVADSTSATISAFLALAALIIALGLLGRSIIKKSGAPLHSLNALRATVAVLPFLLVWQLFEHGETSLPETLRRSLLAVYQAVRVAPEPGAAFWLAAVLVLCHYIILSALRDRAEQRRHLAEARAELKAIGITRRANLASALHGMRTFAREMRLYDHGDPHRPSELHPIVDVIAPDPWADGMPRHFVLVSLSFPKTSVLGLMRAETRFVHPLPDVLAEAWHRGEDSAAALPRLLALIEPRLKAGNYLGIRRRQALRLLRIGRWLVAGTGVTIAAAVWLAQPDVPDAHFHGVVFASAAAGAGLVAAMFARPAHWLLHERHLVRRLRAARGACTPGPSDRDRQTHV